MQASHDDIDLSTLFAAIKRNLFRLLVTTGLAGSLTYGALCLVPPSYKSTAQIILQPSSSSLLRLRSQESASPDAKVDEGEVASQAEVIRSRDLLRKVVAAEHLDQLPDYNPALPGRALADRLLGLFSGSMSSMEPMERALTVLQQNVRVGEVPKTRLINIDVTARSPALAAKLANELAQAYLENNRSGQIKDASEATTWLGSNMADVKAQAEAAETALERFRAQSGLLSGQNNVTLNNQQLSELNTQLTQATAARTEAEARSHIIHDMVASGRVESSQDVVKSANMQQLFQQKLRVERDIAELSATLLPGHPRMQQLTAQLKIAGEGLREEAKRVAAGIDDDLKIAAAREQALQASIVRLTETELKSSESQAQLSSLEREVQSKRNTYDLLLQRLGEASNRRDRASVSALAGLNESASPSSVPDSPKKTQMTLFAAGAAFLLGLVIVITRELLGGGVRPAMVVAAPAQAAPASSTPRIKDGRALAKFVAARAKATGTCRTLITGETQMQDARPAAYDLARQLTGAGASVVLVDWSQGADGSPGLWELATGTASFERVLHSDPHGAGHYIGPGAAGATASLRSCGASLEQVFDALDAICQHVIVVADRARAKDVLEALDGRFGAAAIVGEPGRELRAPIEGGILGYDVPDLAVAWLEPAKSASASSRFSRPQAAQFDAATA